MTWEVSRAVSWLKPRRGSVLLALLLALLLIRITVLDRDDWPGFVGDEATYLMATESLAWDGDYVYQRGDYDRFVEHWGQRPDLLLFLQSNDHGETLVYGKPFFFPLAAAPLTRLWPTRGALLTNLLLLALAAWFAVRALGEFLGEWAEVWVAAFLFGSVAFAYTVWAHADSFLMSMTLIAMSLAVIDGHSDGSGAGAHKLGTWSVDRRMIRWFAIGALLALVGFSRPFYSALVLPAVALMPRERRSKSVLAFGLGLFLVVGVSVGAHWSLAGAATSYTGERGGFYARDGLPEVDFAGTSWDEAIHRSGNFAWYQARQPWEQETRLGLWLWNTVYFLLGEHVGIVPYFLPIVLVLFCVRFDRSRWALLVAIAAALAGFFLYRPFNFFGGGAAIANRYFLPLYPAAWFLIGRRPNRVVLRYGPVVIFATSLVFLWPLWSGLGAYPLTQQQTYRFVAPAAKALLPYETTQSHLKPGGQEDVVHQGFWIRVLSPGTRADADRIWARPNQWVELLVLQGDEIETIEIVGPAADRPRLEVSTGDLISESRQGDVVAYRVRMPSPRARHPMWWSWEPLTLYRLRLRFVGGVDQSVVGFYLRSVRAAQ